MLYVVLDRMVATTPATAATPRQVLLGPLNSSTRGCLVACVIRRVADRSARIDLR
jgi:hypothetical protein